MDRPLSSKNTAHISESARNLLSTSSSFEPFVPVSQHNTLYALKLLGSLAEFAKTSMIVTTGAHTSGSTASHASGHPPSSAGEATTAAVSKNTPLPALSAHLSAQKPSSSTLNKPFTPWNDRAILNALLEVRNSGKTMRRTSGIYSSILKADAPPNKNNK